jgi:RNA polymerase subunit RPABC4/transcription elongation factor Spt4
MESSVEQNSALHSALHSALIPKAAINHYYYFFCSILFCPILFCSVLFQCSVTVSNRFLSFFYFFLFARPPTAQNKCTTSYFEGIVAVCEPQGSWVAKWQRISNLQPGMYALAVEGELPDDVIEFCEGKNFEIKCHKKKDK